MTIIDLMLTMAAIVFTCMAFRFTVLAWLEWRDRKRWEDLRTQRPYIRRN